MNYLIMLQLKIWKWVYLWFALIAPFRVVSPQAQLQRIMHVVYASPVLLDSC